MVEHPGNGVVQRLHKLLALGVAAEQGDVELLRRFTAAGDSAAFAALVRRHGPMVLGVCRRLLRESSDADDAFQATFAILMRKAASLSHPERLAGWLFQVAYRTARRARTARAQRRSRELPLEDVAVETPIAEFIWRELQPIFDEEVNRLPERLRLPIVLCFMEGRSKRAAAQLLNWPEGTVSSRLQRARELLRGRLARRGVTVPAGALSLALVQGTTSAVVPTSLLTVTIQSASLIATGSALPAPVAILAHGVIHSMLITKLKVIAVLALTVGIVGGGTGWLIQGGEWRSGGALAKQPEQTKEKSGEDARPGHFTIEEKEPARVGDVMIVGNSVTSDNVIRRELNLYPGQILSYPDLLQAENRLRRLGMFEDDPSKGIKPSVEIEHPEVDQPYKKIVVRVQEKKTGKFIDLVDAERALAELKAAADDREADKAIEAQASLAKYREVIATMKENAIRESKKAMEKAKDTFDVKSRELARLQQLFPRNAATAMELNRAKEDLDLARTQFARAETIQKEIDPKSDDNKSRVLGPKELSNELVNAEAALAELDAADQALKYYEANVDIEVKAASSAQSMIAAKASLAKAIAEKMGKQWNVIRQAKIALEKAKQTIKQKEADLQGAQALKGPKTATQVTLDRAKVNLELARAQLARAEAILDVCSARLLQDSDAWTKQAVQSRDRILWLKEIPDELVDAEAALAEFEAARHTLDYCEANRKIEWHGKIGATIEDNASLAKAITEITNKEWRAIRVAKKAVEKADETLQLKKTQLARLKQIDKDKVVSQKEMDSAKANVELASAQLARAEAILVVGSTSRDKVLHVSENQANVSDPAVIEAEAKLERLMKLKANGAVAEAEIEAAQISLAEARIAFELRSIVDLRQKAFDRAKRLREANVITQDELKKALDALEAAKHRQTERK